MTKFYFSKQDNDFDIFEAILSGLSHPLFVIDDNDCLIYANTSGEEFFKSGINFLKGASLTSFINSDHGVFNMIKRVRQSRASLSDQGVDLVSPKLGQRLVDIQISPLLDFDREVIGIIIALQERALAEKLRGQEQFRGAARSMSSLSSLLAHEIKNPLAGIRGAAELLGSTVDFNETRELTDLIVNETDRIASLLTKMENLAGGQAIAREPVNIHEIVDHSINLAKRSFAKDRQIITSFDPSLPDTEGDRNLLIQVLLNLIKNSCEATDINGKIEIITSFNLEARYSAMNSGDGSPLIIEVIDNGKGIDTDLRHCIFDPFVSNKPFGSGLGLSLVASTMTDHGGGVDVLSRPGMTSFKLNLPVSSRSSSPQNKMDEMEYE